MQVLQKLAWVTFIEAIQQDGKKHKNKWNAGFDFSYVAPFSESYPDEGNISAPVQPSTMTLVHCVDIFMNSKFLGSVFHSLRVLGSC